MQKFRHILSKKMQSHFQIHHVAQDQRDIRVCCVEPAAEYDERESISSRSIIKLYVMAILVSHLHWN